MGGEDGGRLERKYRLLFKAYLEYLVIKGRQTSTDGHASRQKDEDKNINKWKDVFTYAWLSG